MNETRERGEGLRKRTPFARRFGALLASPRGGFLAPFAGVLLTLPSVANGLVMEDAALRSRVRGALGTSLAMRLDLFSFWPADPGLRTRFTDAGLFPWFAAPELRIEFWRPLSSALHFVDFTLFDRWPWLMHVESIALYAAAIALATAIYRRLLPVPVAMLAALLYALDQGHGIPVGWLSNRNALLATVFGFAAILAHDRWRRAAWRPGAWLGPIAFALALLSGESGLGALGYLVAYAVTIEPSSKARGVKALLAYALVAVAWQIVYRRLGYGTHATGFYLDPISDPAAYLSALPGRAMALLLGQLAVPPAGLYNLVPLTGKALIVGAAALFLAYVVRKLGPEGRTPAETRFFALGMLLSLAPVVATFPDNRLLLFAGLGAFGIVASVIGDFRADAPADAPRALRRAWIAIHLVLAPLLLPITSLAMPLLARRFEPPPADRALAEQTIVLLNPPMVVYSIVPWVFPTDPARLVPRRVHAFVGAVGRAAITREDARTLRVDWSKGATFDPALSLFRAEDRPIHEGDTFAVPGMRAEIVRLDEDRAPASVRYRFDRDVDDPSFRWVAWTGAFEDTMPPPIGGRKVLGP